MDCIFCKIIEGSIPSRKVYESERIVAFHDIEPLAPVHILLVPKKHIPTTNDIAEEDIPDLGEIHLTAQKLAEQFQIKETGYRLVNNCGKDGGQLVYHLHYHLIGGAPLGSESELEIVRSWA